MRVPLVFALILAAVAASPAADNLLPNGDFEKGRAKWRFWQQVPGTATAEPSDDGAHTGRSVLKVANRGKGGGNLFSQDVPCEPNTEYTLTVWAKTRDAKGTAVGLWGLDGDGKTIRHFIGRSTPVPDNLTRFMRFSREVTTPENCTRLRAHLTNHGGTVYWDSVEIRKGPLCIDEVIPPPKPPPGSRNMVPNSGFEEERVGWRFWRKYLGEAEDAFDEAVKHSGTRSYRIINHGQGGANVFSEDLPCKPNTTYTISAFVKTKDARRCILAGWTLDKDGKVISYAADGAARVPPDLPEFRRFAHTFKTADNAAVLRAHLSDGGGTVWWDDVQIEEGDSATPYRPGMAIVPRLSAGRKDAVRYTKAIIRHAKVTDLCEQAERAAAYMKACGKPVDGIAAKAAAVWKGLREAEPVLQVDRIAPDFMNLDYERINTILDGAESHATEALKEAIVALGEVALLPPPPSKLEGIITPEKLANRFLLFPLLSMGRCGTAFFNGSYDWAMLEPFGFEAIAPGAHGRKVRGTYDFSEAEKRIESTAKLGLLADIQLHGVREIRQQLFDRYGEEIYLHAADGRWSEAGGCHQMINIWHPEVRRVNHEYLEAYGRAFRDSPTILCYELINEPSLYISKWAERFRSEHYGPGGYSKAARAAWPVYLKKKYGTIGDLNAQWGTQYADFNAVEPPADLNAPPPKQLPDPAVPLAIEFNRFRMAAHSDYFRDSVAALRRGDPNHAIMPQFIAGTGPRVIEGDDLLGLGLAGWDFFSTHDWPGDNPAVTCLYAYSINRYIKLPLWEDEFIFSHWMQKGVDPRLVRPAIERNLWRQIAWGKRGIHLFNLENEWRAGFPDNWNNSILNTEADSRIVRFATGAIKVVKDRGERVAPLLFDTEIEHQGIGILQPTSTLCSGAVARKSNHDSTRICSWLLRHHWTPFFVPEECILDGREDLSKFKLIIAPLAVCVADGLEEKLIDWIRAGGVLVTSGPAGIYDERGRRAMKLLSQVLGVKSAESNDSGWVVCLADGGEAAPDEVLSAAAGKGRIWLVPNPISRRENPEMHPLGKVLSEAVPSQPIRCRHEQVELILRRDGDGNRFVCATHLDYGAPIETEIEMAGEFRSAVDLTVGEGVKVPVRIDGGKTIIPLRLGPGCAAVLRVDR